MLQTIFNSHSRTGLLEYVEPCIRRFDTAEFRLWWPILGKASVIVSTYTSLNLHFVLSCVESLRKQSVKPYEMILVLDPKPDLVEFYKSHGPSDIKVIVSNRCGLSNARNAGVASATGEILVFIDDDAIAEDTWLERLLDGYSSPDVVSVGGLIVPAWDNGCPLWFPEELNWIIGCSYKGLPETKSYVRNAIGCNMSFRRIVFEKVGNFRSDIGRFGKRLLAGEEAELSLRILEAMPDAKIVYDPTAIVHHRVPKSRGKFSYLFKRSFYEGVSKAMIGKREKGFQKSIYVENQYLKYLIGNAIPTRLKEIYRPKSFMQLLVLVFSATTVFLGYAVGKLGQPKN